MKKSLNRVLGLILALMLVFSTAVSAYAADTEPSEESNTEQSSENEEQNGEEEENGQEPSVEEIIEDEDEEELGLEPETEPEDPVKMTAYYEKAAEGLPEEGESEAKNTLTFYFDDTETEIHDGVKYEVPVEIESEADIPWTEIAGEVEAVIFDDTFSTVPDPEAPETEKGVKPETFAYWFKGFENLEEIDLSNLDTSEAVDMTSMFEGCEKLAAIYVDDLWTTDKVTDSDDMFKGCEALTGPCGSMIENAVSRGINGDDTENVTCAKIDTFVALGEGEVGYLTSADIIDISEYILEATGAVYTGEPYIPEVILKTAPEGEAVDPENYGVTYYSDETCEEEITASGIVNAGTYYVKAYGLGEKNHKGETEAAVFEIEKAVPTLELSMAGVSAYYGSLVEIGVDYNGDGEITVSADPAEIAELSYDADKKLVSALAAKAVNGTVTVEAAEGDNFLAASADFTLEVKKITVSEPTPKENLVYIGVEQLGFNVYDDQLFTLENYTAVNAGEYEATAVLKDKDNYIWPDGTSEDKKIAFAIGKKQAVITPKDMKKAFGEEDPLFTATVEGEVNGEKIEYKLEREEGEKVGEYKINVILANSAVNENYEIEMPEGKFTIEKAEPELTVWPDKWVVGKGSSVTSVIVFDSDAELDIKSDDDKIAAAAYDKENKLLVIYGHEKGEVKITLSAKESDSYLEAKPVEIKVKVTDTVDKTTLNEIIAFAKKLDTENLTEESLKAFTEALENAEVIAAKEDAVQTEVDAAASNLVKAIDKLDRKKEFPNSNVSSDKIAVWVPAAVEGLVYNGEEQIGVVIPKDAPYTIEGEKATDAGKYTASLKLKDDEKYIWSDGSKKDKTVTWYIDKFTPTIALSPESLTLIYGYGDSVNYSYNGDAEVMAEAKDAAVAEAAAGTMDKFNVIYVNSKGAGETIVTVEAKENKNYYAATAELHVTVLPQPVVIPEGVPGLYYTGTAQTGVYGNAALYTLSDVTGTDAGEYTAKAGLIDRKNYVWANGQTEDQQIPFVIAKCPVTILPNDTGKAYGDADPELTAEGGYGFEGSGPVYTLEREAGETVGTYAINVLPADDVINNNFEITCETGTFTIYAASVAIPEGLNLQYTGAPQCGITKDEAAPYTVSGDIQTEAGSYTATVLLNDPVNYMWSDGTTEGKAIPWSIYMPE